MSNLLLALVGEVDGIGGAGLVLQAEVGLSLGCINDRVREVLGGRDTQAQAELQFYCLDVGFGRTQGGNAVDLMAVLGFQILNLQRCSNPIELGKRRTRLVLAGAVCMFGKTSTALAEAVFEPRLKLLGKPQYASDEELKANPRSRSAVMRVAEKLR